MKASRLPPTLRVVKRTIISVVGGTVLLIGIALLLLPGPAFIVIPIGLAILATEYAWARRWLRKAREYTSSFISKGSDEPSLHETESDSRV